MPSRWILLRSTVENCTITGMSGAAVASSNGGSVTIADSTLKDNGGVAMIGAGSANLTVDRVRAERTSGAAITFGAGGQLTIRDSFFSGGSGGFIHVDAIGNEQPRVDIVSSSFIDNGGPGLAVSANDSSRITLNLRDSTIARTSYGVSVVAVPPAAARSVPRRQPDRG